MAKSFWRELLGWARRGGAERRRFGDFLPVRPVHDGEKACVYRARRMAATLPAEAGDLYALKVYKAGYDRTARRMQKRYGLPSEGEIGLALTAAASDPAFPLVQTFACGWEYDDPALCHYLAQEFVDGANVKHMIGCDDPRLRAKRLEILQAAGRALAFMHDRRLVHRDVCSDNILFSRDGRTKLIDLGFAAPAGLAFEEKSGTPSTMSPEQCQGSRLAPASDIYSFGVVLFEVFTGSLPFSARGSDNPALAARRASELMQKHLHDPPPRPTQLAPDLPEGLEPIILRCLEKAPERRYPNMKELLAQLAKVQDQ